MLIFILKRFIEMLFTLWLLMTITFFLLRLAPGGPFDGEKTWPPEIQKAIEEKYGLNLPLSEQYTQWLGGVVRGDLKESFQYQDQSVSELILQSLPYSLIIGAGAWILAMSMGLSLGMISAWKKGSFWDGFSSFVAVAGVSLPPYLVASILIVIFAVQLKWVPVALAEGPSSYILPIITLGVRPAATIARLVRTALIETMTQDYIRTARAKGLLPLQVVLKHALKNAMVPILTILGPITAAVLTGSFIVEWVFQIPGTGKHFVTSVINRDYPIAMGITLFYGIVLMLSNFTVDLLYRWVDPRIRLS